MVQNLVHVFFDVIYLGKAVIFLCLQEINQISYFQNCIKSLSACDSLKKEKILWKKVGLISKKTN